MEDRALEVLSMSFAVVHFHRDTRAAGSRDKYRKISPLFIVL